MSPCPVDCISLPPTGDQPSREERQIAASEARKHFERRIQRITRDRTSKRARNDVGAPVIDKQVVERAIARARERLAQRRSSHE